MASQISYPTWIPTLLVRSMKKWFDEPLATSGLTWMNRVLAIIRCARNEIERVQKSNDKLKDKVGLMKDEMKGHMAVIKRQGDSILDLRIKNEALKGENNKKNNTFLASFINEANSEHYNKARHEDKEKLKTMRELFLSQKEKTSKAIAEKEDDKYKYDMMRMEFTALKLSYNNLEKNKEAAIFEKMELMKRNQELTEEKTNAEQNCENIKKRLEEEMRTNVSLKMKMTSLAQQLNIPIKFLF